MQSIHSTLLSYCPDKLSKPVAGITVSAIVMATALVAVAILGVLAQHQLLPDGGISNYFASIAQPEAVEYACMLFGFATVVVNGLVLYGAWKNGQKENEDTLRKELYEFNGAPSELNNFVKVFTEQPDQTMDGILYFVHNPEEEYTFTLYAKSGEDTYTLKVTYATKTENRRSQTMFIPIYTYQASEGVSTQSETLEGVIEGFCKLHHFSHIDLLTKDGQDYTSYCISNES